MGSFPLFPNSFKVGGNNLLPYLLFFLSTGTGTYTPGDVSCLPGVKVHQGIGRFITAFFLNLLLVTFIDGYLSCPCLKRLSLSYFLNLINEFQ